MKPRTLRLDDTVIVLEHVRGFRLETRYLNEARPAQVYTSVWLEELAQPVCIFGDHLDTLQKALEGHDQRLVLLESPYAGDVERNLRYARAAMRDCFMRGEFPFASHLLYPQHGILDDKNAAERALGIEAGLAWGRHAARSVVYTDLGTTDGMRHGLDRAREQEREAVTRSVQAWAQ